MELFSYPIVPNVVARQSLLATMAEGTGLTLVLRLICCADATTAHPYEHQCPRLNGGLCYLKCGSDSTTDSCCEQKRECRRTRALLFDIRHSPTARYRYHCLALDLEASPAVLPGSPGTHWACGAAQAVARTNTFQRVRSAPPPRSTTSLPTAEAPSGHNEA